MVATEWQKTANTLKMKPFDYISSPVENICARVERLPMMVVMAGVAVGIVVADRLRPELWVVAVGFVVALVAALWLGAGRKTQKNATQNTHRKTLHRWLVVSVVLLAGALAIALRRAGDVPLEGWRAMEIEFLSVAHHYPEKVDFDARVVAVREGEEWRRTAMDVRVMVPAEMGIEVGDRVLSRSRLRGFDERTSYGGYMLRVGVAGRIYLDTGQVAHHAKGRASVGERLRQRAMQHIEALRLTPSVGAVVSAMSVGERSRLTPEMRRSYVRAGGAHLLAVSGLHIGFLFVVVNLLLMPLTALRGGQLARSAVAVVVIWLYAMMVGMSPSVMRAAVMFTLVQLSTALGSRTTHLNTLCFAATMMLLWDARMLYDAGFLLSVLAVAAIVEWGVPLSRWLCRERPHFELTENLYSWRRAILRRVGRWVVTTFVVSLVASVATMPLAASMFGEVSLWSVGVGTLMVLLCAVAVSSALVWVMMPLPMLQGVARWLLEGVVGTMNGIAEWCADSRVMAHSVEFDAVACWLIYIAFAIVTVAIWSVPKRR